jgi:hypothetical protein
MCCKGYCNEPDGRGGRFIGLVGRSDDIKCRLKYKNYKFGELMI